MDKFVCRIRAKRGFVMKRILAFVIAVIGAGFLFISQEQAPPPGIGQSLIPANDGSQSEQANPISFLKDRVSAFGEACAKWGVGSRQAYGHATDLAKADFASTPLTPAEIREMRTEFVETIIERGKYEEAIGHLTKIIAEEEAEQQALDALGTTPEAGHKSKIGEAQASRAALLAFAYENLEMYQEARENYRMSRQYLGAVYGVNHPNLIYVFQNEIAAAELARESGKDIGNLHCDKRDLGIMQKRAIQEGFVDDDEIDLSITQPGPADIETFCPEAPVIPVELPLEKIKVFYGTNRNQTKSANPKKAYGNRRGGLRMGSIDMTVRVYPKVGDLPPKGVADKRIDDDGDDKDYGVHIVLNKINKSRSKTDFTTDLGQWVSSSGDGQKEVFVYIHGHNVVFDAAARRAAQLAIDLDMRQGAVFYSWPSGQRLTLYGKSQINARRSAKHLTEFLETLASVEQIDKIHLIAHSMGNALLTRALNTIDVEGFSAKNRPFGQIIWASPDVASVDFVDYTTKFKNEDLADGMTLYASSLDRALCISNWLSDMKRAGQTPPLPDVARVVPTVDTSGGYRQATDLIAHTDYADGAIDDIKAVLWLNLKPDQRCFLGNNLIDDVAYWATGSGQCNEESFRSVLSIVRAAQRAGLDPDFDLDQSLDYIRRDVEPVDWEQAQLLAERLNPTAEQPGFQE